ncbi:hypothetical protein PIROE2DRAFT_5351 [Piromyces sp. E2]|nr:hypothetical protein PIROE2DRAFT_5351 [Piromyces sp. E2]|eukprot:OUM67287.1 hypothetical protein PIROE2DRAFT_5351 [Piromyces sp. E2]
MNDLKRINQYIKEKVYKQDQFPSISLDHLYQENLDKIKNIEQHIEKTSLLIKNKCNIKDMVFLKIEWGIKNPITKIVKTNNSGENDSDGNDRETIKKNNKLTKPKIESTMISSLKQGNNTNKYVRLRIISEVSIAFGFNRSFIAVDEVNKYISLSIYNLNNKIELVGQEIIIYEPELFKIKASYKNNDIEYNTIRIDLYNKRSLKHYIEKEWLNYTDVNDRSNNEVLSTKIDNLTTLKRMNLIVNGEFLNDITDIDYSKIMIDCS